MSELKWCKSSYSEAAGNACVEMATVDALVAIRDSKHPHLRRTTVSRSAWAEFTGALGAGRLPVRP